ncbi:MAG TPA: hypothetical protein DDY20_06090 [Desulfobulbaceae bacterium]|nr:hypothetical protein [Desulfobulbaceae bacterium]
MDTVHQQNASSCFQQAMQLLHAGRQDEALKYLGRAIELDPQYAEAYRKRGEILMLRGRALEAKDDLRKAAAVGARTARSPKGKTTGKIDLKSVPSIYDDLLAEGPLDSDILDFDGQAYAYVFSDDTLESDDLLAGLAPGQAGRIEFSAILEFLDGRREEGLIIGFFEPGRDEIILASGGAEGQRVVSLQRLGCIRLARVPDGFSRNMDVSCHVEVIETIDGNIYHEAIHPEQRLDNVLYGFSTKQGSRFKYTLIPHSSIRKRFQRRHLGQILLDRKLIAGNALRQALEEHSELKLAKFGKIIAKQANILYAAVEFEIHRAFQENRQGLKTGEILRNAGLVSEEQITSALEHQERQKKKRLGQFLIEKGILQERDVYIALAEKFRIPFVDLRQQKVTKTILGHLPRELIRKLHVLPLAVREDTLVVATLLPDPAPVCDVVHRYASPRNVEFVLVQPSHLKNVIRVLFKEQG